MRYKMKIRNGFVSNSSSSSFILNGNRYTIFDVAEQMLDIRNSDGDWKGYNEKDTIAEARRLNVDPDTPTAFVSCNYDTFIQKREGDIYVSTCNNHPFYEMDLERAHTPHVGGGHDELEWQEMEAQTYFWWPETDLKLRPVIYDERKALIKAGTIPGDYCKDHWKDYMQLEDGSFECMRCCTKENLKFLKGIVAKIPKPTDRVRRGLRLRRH